MNKGKMCISCKMCINVRDPWRIDSQQLPPSIIPNTYYTFIGVVNSKPKRGHTGIVNELTELSANNREWKALW